MKRILMAVVFLGLCNFASAEFIDENEIPQWAETSINLVSDEKIMTGFGDGSFRPAQNLNRAEAVILLSRIKKENLDQYKPNAKFADVPQDAWYSRAVSMGSEKGWLKGRADGKFHPADVLNRAEFATMITRAFDLLDEVERPAAFPFKDIPTNVWFSKPIFAFYDYGLIRNTKTEKFNPGEIVTRAEAAWVLGQILGKQSLMGTSKENDLSSNRKIDSRRVAIKPRDFNPNKQSVEVAKKELVVVAVPKDDVVIVKKEDEWFDMGTIRIKNNLEDRAEVNTIRLKLRFDATNIGPESNFWGRLQGDGTVKEVRLAQNGEFLATGLTVSLLAGEEKVFRFKIKPDTEEQFFSKSGGGKISVEEIMANSYGTFTKEYSNRSTAIRYAPINVESRDLSTLEFQP